MEFKECTLDGKRISYTDSTEFFVEVGKGEKGAYKTRYKVTGNLGQAVILYNGLNIGNGYKKRIRVPAFNKPILARATS